jgi:AAA family ATPase
LHQINKQTKISALRQAFKEAVQHAPSIVAIDNLETIVPKQDDSPTDFEIALGEEMDELMVVNGPDNLLPRVLVIATISALNQVPRTLTKAGRFGTKVMLSIPDVDARKKILRSLVSNPDDVLLSLLDKVGEGTHAYTPEDLVLLVREAYNTANVRIDQNGAEGKSQEKALIQQDFDEALLLRSGGMILEVKRMSKLR